MNANRPPPPTVPDDAPGLLYVCGDCAAGLVAIGASRPPGPHSLPLGGCEAHRTLTPPQATHVVVAAPSMLANWASSAPPRAELDPWLTVPSHSLHVATVAAHLLGPGGAGASQAEIDQAVDTARRILVSAKG